MKVAFIGQKGIPAQSGGVERHVEGLAVRLVAEDVSNDIVVYTRPWYTAKTLSYYKGVRLVSLPSFYSKHLDAITHSYLALWHACWIERSDIIHIHAVGPALLTWLPRLLRPQAKVIVTFHCIDRQHQKWNGFAKLMLWLGEWMAMKFAHEVIAVSKNLQQYAYELYGRKVQYIPNGIAAVIAQPASSITQQFGLLSNDYILMVSRLVQHKGVHHLIRAFKQLSTNKKLVIVGAASFTDRYFQELKGLAQGDDRIIFTGLQTGKTLAELYSNAYCFVLPSESEGLSMVLLEASAYGKAVIASDIPANLEVLNTIGIIFPSGDVVALREALAKLIVTPELAEALGAKARTAILTKYHWTGVVFKTQQLYRTIVTCYTPSRVKAAHPIH